MGEYNAYGVLDLGAIDTTPGARHPLAPPSDFAGDAEAYLDLMRRRMNDVGARQQLLIAARHALEGPCSGPYADQAKALLTKLRTWRPPETTKTSPRLKELALYGAP